jgi:hypothetical protein
MEENNDKNVEQQDMMLAYMKGDNGHFFLEFVQGTGMLRVEDNNGKTIGRLLLGNKRSIDLLEQRLEFLKKLIFKSSYVSSKDVVSDLLSEQEFVGRLLE